MSLRNFNTQYSNMQYTDINNNDINNIKNILFFEQKYMELYIKYIIKKNGW